VVSSLPVRNILRISVLGLLFLSFALAILTPAFADVPKTECTMSCCRLGMHGAHAMPNEPATCGRCECSLNQGTRGSFAVPAFGLPPSVLPATAALPEPRPALAHLAASDVLLVSLARGLPYKPPQS
jgi:hypothetical protein